MKAARTRRCVGRPNGALRAMPGEARGPSHRGGPSAQLSACCAALRCASPPLRGTPCCGRPSSPSPGAACRVPTAAVPSGAASRGLCVTPRPPRCSAAGHPRLCWAQGVPVALPGGSRSSGSLHPRCPALLPPLVSVGGGGPGCRSVPACGARTSVRSPGAPRGPSAPTSPSAHRSCTRVPRARVGRGRSDLPGRGQAGFPQP